MRRPKRPELPSRQGDSVSPAPIGTTGVEAE